jgi:hypothetical protein
MSLQQLFAVNFALIFGELPAYSQWRPVSWVQHGAFCILVAAATITNFVGLGVRSIVVGIVISIVAVASGRCRWSDVQFSVGWTESIKQLRAWVRQPGPLQSARGIAAEEAQLERVSPYSRMGSAGLELVSVALFLQGVPTALRSPLWQLPQNDSPPVDFLRVLQRWSLSAAFLPVSMSSDAQADFMYSLMILVPLGFIVAPIYLLGERGGDLQLFLMNLLAKQGLPMFGDIMGAFVERLDELPGGLKDRTFSVSIGGIVLACLAVLSLGQCHRTYETVRPLQFP